MNYDRFKANKKEYTKISSEVNRSANYAMLALSTVILIKIFMGNSESSTALLLSTLLSVGSLFFDFLQYAYFSLIYSIVFRKVDAAKQGLKLKPSPTHDPIEMPQSAMNIGNSMFWVKLALTLASFCFLLRGLFILINSPVLIEKLLK